MVNDAIIKFCHCFFEHLSENEKICNLILTLVRKSDIIIILKSQSEVMSLKCAKYAAETGAYRHARPL